MVSKSDLPREPEEEYLKIQFCYLYTYLSPTLNMLSQKGVEIICILKISQLIIK